MSLTAQIGSSDSSFKLSQKLVASLAEKFGFKFEDGWNTVSNRTVDNVQKRLKRERRRANPASQVKHPRTAFSFFTQQQRPIEAGKHKDATFGQLSRFVSEAWKALSPAQLQTYKDMEVKDKARYQTERAAALAAVPALTPAAEGAAPATPADTEAKPKKERKAKATAPSTPAAVAAVAATAPATEAAKPAKAAKATKAAAAPVATPVTAEVAKPAKAPKAPKAPKAAATPAAATPAAATPAAATPAAATPAKAAKAPKAKAAGKA